MHLVFRIYADALVTITITEDEAGTTRAPPEGIPQTRVEEAI